MKTLLKAVVISAGMVAAAPVLAQAQKTPPAIVVTVDNQKIFTDCTACKAAQAQLQTQATQLQSYAQQLGQPLQTEADAIQKAAGGKAPDAALQQRIQSLQTREGQANQQLQQRQQAFQRNRAYVAQQINQKLGPIISQVMQAHGANLALDVDATLAAGSSLDVTAEVLAQLNSQLPSVSTTAPAAPAQPNSGR